MSETKVRTQEGMFHIQFPARRDFWTWTELGCLARALGFPTDLIRHNVAEEVEVEEEGMYIQQLGRMIDLKLLNPALHRSFNMHTSDWNICVICKALRLLNLSALRFEEVHNIRVAYATYEAVDMKGLVLEQRTLLRTLKMCHRVISPKKLMHRVKHMKSRLEEANRIQLYEFFDLILWCDYMEHYEGAHKVGEADGKEKDLYNLVDFESLLSHQDQRRSRALDQRYLAEEWDFGREQLGSKHMFKGEVVYTDQRIKQTRTQKKNYRGLKRAVTQSQRRVYRAHAGSIRQRPISAPDMSMYSTPRGTPRGRTTSASAMFQSVQRRFHSATSREGNSRLDLADRPTLPEYVRAHTPSVVTSQELDEASLKMEMLKFDIITLETRCQVKKEDEMNFYIPEYQSPAKEDNSDRAGRGEEKKTEHWTPEIIDKLAYPPYHLPTHHAHTCDARFRGWKPADHKGRQKILTVPTYDSSPHGQLLASQRSAMLAPVTTLHKDYVVRYTSGKEATQQQRAKRPCTAPTASPRSKPLKRLGCHSAGHHHPRRCDTDDSTTTTSKTTDNIIDDHGEDFKNEESAQEAVSKMVQKTYPDPYGKYSQEHSRSSEGQTEGLGHRGDSVLASGGQASSQHHAGDGYCGGKDQEKYLPQGSSKNGPSRRHCGSKVVDVGLIGTITLLESIQEHDTEDPLTNTFSSSSLSSSPRPPSPSTDPQPTTFPGPGARQENLDQTSKSIPAGWSRHPESGKERVSTPPNNTNLVQGLLTEKSAASAVSLSAEPDRGMSRIGQGGEEAGFQKPKERFGQAYAVASNSQDRQGHDQSLDQNHDQPSRAREGVPLRTEQRTEVRKPRVNSAASSILSDVSDPPPREALTPLTSVTVTIKNKHQHVTRTRVISDVDDQPDAMEGRTTTPSPFGFKRSSPCITSTPRRRRPSPATTPTPRGRQAAKPTVTTKTSQASHHTTNPNHTRDPVRRPHSAGGKGLGRKTPNLPHPETDPDGRLHWVQDQILAMSPSCEQKPQDEDEKEHEGEGKEIHDEESPPKADNVELDGHKKPGIRFSKEQALLEKRESDYRRYMERRKASEGALRLKSYDLSGEMARRFIFNKATTQRLIQRVQDVISPELRTRIRTGDTGLKVI